MDLTQIAGNEQAKLALMHMVQKGALAHLLLFAGPAGANTALFAEALAQALSVASDVHHYRPEGKSGMHSIDSMRALGEKVCQGPYQARKAVFIVHDADRMLPTSANALLKSFEEPHPASIIILLAPSPGHLLPTILSRCRSIHFHAPQTAPKANTQLLKILSFGRFQSYQDLREAAALLSKSVEECQSQVEENCRQELLGEHPEELAAHLRQAIEKEMEGIVSLRFFEEVNNYLDTIQCWYRDLHLLQVGGDKRLLFYPESASSLQRDPPALELILTACREARLALSRSTSLQTCLEALFLRLRFIYTFN